MALDRRSIDCEYQATMLVSGVRPRACTLIHVPNLNAADRHLHAGFNVQDRLIRLSTVLSPDLICYLSVDRNPDLEALPFHSLFGCDWMSIILIGPHVVVVVTCVWFSECRLHWYQVDSNVQPLSEILPNDRVLTNKAVLSLLRSKNQLIFSYYTRAIPMC
jgi:hypothetical protein